MTERIVHISGAGPGKWFRPCDSVIPGAATSMKKKNIHDSMTDKLTPAKPTTAKTTAAKSTGARPTRDKTRSGKLTPTKSTPGKLAPGKTGSGKPAADKTAPGKAPATRTPATRTTGARTAPTPLPRAARPVPETQPETSEKRSRELPPQAPPEASPDAFPEPRHPAEAVLAAADPDFAALIRRTGPCGLTPDRTGEPYEALVRAVLYQQLHGRAAAAIFGRLKALSDDRCPPPEILLAHSFDTLRACGLSARKIQTLQALAQARLDGIVPSRAEADHMSEEDLILRLTSLRGIGRWTVEMLLIFTLGRPDVMPVDDFGVSEGWRRLKGLETRLRPRQLAEATASLAPWRSVAAWYLWRAAGEGKKTDSSNPVTG